MTFSIVAQCERTGQFGVAVATAMHAVGKLATHARPGTGAVATQAMLNPYFGYDGLRLLTDGRSAEETRDILLSLDPDPETRQLGIVDAARRTAAHTGRESPDWAGDAQGPGFSVQGNRLAGQEVLDAVVAALRASPDEDLAERLLEALEAGVAAGGDRKGERSANIRVMAQEEYPLWDVRVDDHDQPVRELRRLYHVFEESLLPQIREMPKREDFPGPGWS